MKSLLFAVVLLFCTQIFSAVAQAAQCVCNNGCKVAAGPYPPPAGGQPTSCTIEKGGVVVAGSSCSIVSSSTIPVSNTAVCQPADAAYNPGVAGSVAPLAILPAQPLGNVTLVMKVFNAAAPGGVASVPFTFDNVAGLSTAPLAPANLRIVP